MTLQLLGGRHGLEAFPIGAAIRLLMGEASDSDFLLHTGLPLSMMAPAILIALGVADQLREQRRALHEAERRAVTDPLAGVLNRRFLIERLEAASARAQAREMPIAQKPAAEIDRRVSVAPMMDWTDVRNLMKRVSTNACSKCPAAFT